MIYQSANVFSLGKKGKKEENTITPGPGAYENEEITAQKTQTFSFPKEEKFKNLQNSGPGPGNYDGAMQGLFGKEAPKFSIGKSEKKDNIGLMKTNGSEVISIPGPGQYDITSEVLDKTRKKAPAVKISQGPKFLNQNNRTPGPGEYQEKSAFDTASPKFPMSTSKRETSDVLVNKATLSHPGPGNYEIEPVIGKEAPKVTLRGKAKDTNYLSTPGPGSYQNDKAIHLRSAPAYKMGNTERKGLFGVDKSTASLPGPGMYNTVSDFDFEDGRKTKGAKFGKDQKFKNAKSNTPGPGYYKIPCAMVHVPMYTGGNFDQQFKFV